MFKIKVFLASKNKRVISKIKRYLRNKEFTIVGESDRGIDAIAGIRKFGCDILILEENLNDMSYLDTIRRVKQYNKRLGIITLLENFENKTQVALTAGSDDVFETSKINKDLAYMVKRVFIIKGSESEGKTEAHIISVFSTKGGVGKTVLSTNIAVMLAAEHKKKVLLIDTDLQFGDCAIGLNVSPRYNIYDMLQDFSQGNEGEIMERLDKHKSGLYILSPPMKPVFAEFIKAEHIKKLLEFFRNEFDYIVIDCPNSFDDRTIMCFENSDRIIFISCVDIATIRSVKEGLNILYSLKVEASRVNIVVNQGSEDLGVRYRDIANTFGKDIWKVIPFDRRFVVTAINNGEPLYFSARKNVVTKAMQDISNLLEAEKQNMYR